MLINGQEIDEQILAADMEQLITEKMDPKDLYTWQAIGEEAIKSLLSSEQSKITPSSISHVPALFPESIAITGWVATLLACVNTIFGIVKERKLIEKEKLILEKEKGLNVEQGDLETHKIEAVRLILEGELLSAGLTKLEASKYSERLAITIIKAIK